MSQVLTPPPYATGPQHSTLAREAEALATAAAGHKRAVSHHRRELRACMEQLAQLRALAARMGVTFSLTGVEETHGQRTTQSHHK